MKIKGLAEKVRALKPESEPTVPGKMTEIGNSLLDHVAGAFVNGYFSNFHEGGAFELIKSEPR